MISASVGKSALDVLANVFKRCFGIIKQINQRFGNFMKIVW